MTVRLLRGAGSYTGLEATWRRNGKPATVPIVNRPERLPTACGTDRPAFDVTDDEAKVSCGSCRRSSEFGTNLRDRQERMRARYRAATIRTAARNRALRILATTHRAEFERIYHDEHVLLALSLGAREYPPDEALPEAPRTKATT